MDLWESLAAQWADEVGCTEAVEWAWQNGLPPLHSPEAERDRCESVAAAQLELHRRCSAPHELAVSEETVRVVIEAARRTPADSWEALRPEGYELVSGARVLDALGLGEAGR